MSLCSWLVLTITVVIDELHLDGLIVAALWRVGLSTFGAAREAQLDSLSDEKHNSAVAFYGPFLRRLL